MKHKGNVCTKNAITAPVRENEMIPTKDGEVTGRQWLQSNLERAKQRGQLTEIVPATRRTRGGDIMLVLVRIQTA